MTSLALPTDWIGSDLGLAHYSGGFLIRQRPRRGYSPPTRPCRFVGEYVDGARRSHLVESRKSCRFGAARARRVDYFGVNDVRWAVWG
jgi:hypothetical protein